ncbi:hypothetical protein [Candidatus Uabimicrobium sp. HlEnr_7]|uniref:hypothetical protein n=1 Tax=Candidatus Uabimicrobium helgolandensis TaxID=3095367 RepID=UPI0035583661
MRVIAKSKKSSFNKLRRKKKKPQKKQKLTILKFKRICKKTIKRLQARKNRSKMALVVVVLIFLGIWWFIQIIPNTHSNHRTTNSKNTSQSTYGTPEKKSVSKKHNSIFYNNSAPKAKNSRTQNYSSAYEN